MKQFETEKLSTSLERDEVLREKDRLTEHMAHLEASKSQLEEKVGQLESAVTDLTAEQEMVREHCDAKKCDFSSPLVESEYQNRYLF